MANESKKNYEKNCQIMREPEIRKVWDQFIQEYATHFPSEAEKIWLRNFQLVQDYINNNSLSLYATTFME